MSIYLASRHVPGLREFVDDYAIGRRTCLVPIAAEPIEGGAIETQAALEAVRAADLEVEFIAHTGDDADPPPPLRDFHVIVLGPGDPFYLLARLRELGLDPSSGRRSRKAASSSASAPGPWCWGRPSRRGSWRAGSPPKTACTSTDCI